METGDVWALINFGEEPVLLTWPQLQLRLGPAEGCRMTAGLPPNVVPPPKDELNVLLAIRWVLHRRISAVKCGCLAPQTWLLKMFKRSPDP